MEGCCNMKMISSRTPQSGLGQLDVIGDIFSFASGLFGKDPQKTEYDRIRQQAWDSLVTLVDEHENFKGAGTLSRTILSKLIDTLDTLMAGFKKYTDGMLAKYPGDAGWITPRFHDYYDFMGQGKAGWQQELATLPVDYVGDVIDYFTGGPDVNVDLPSYPMTPVIDPITGQTTYVPTKAGFDTTSMLLIG